MKPATINPALQFIQTAGVPGLVSGVQTGMLTPGKTLSALWAVGSAIDAYVEAVPQDTSLTGLRERIGGLPARGKIASEMQEKILGLLTTHRKDVELAVRMAIKINTVGQVAITGGAAVANLEAPYDLGADWMWIPAGAFQMGSSDDDPHAYDDEKPLRTVVTGGYFMFNHPVTNGEFRVLLKEAGRTDVRDLDTNFAGDDQPTVRVTQEEAAACSQWLGEKVSKRTGRALIGRLPTEAEWEKAAKGPDGDEFITPATHAQAHIDASATRSVNHPAVYANGYGLKDMIGNVFEWTSDPARSTGSIIIRGASWSGINPRNLRAAFRYNIRPDDRSSYFGFRPLLAPQGSEG